MRKYYSSPSDILNHFWDAPITAVFDQNVVSLATSRSISSLQRARWAGFGGPCFIKIGRSVRYRKSDVLRFLDACKPFQSTTEAQHSKEALA